MSSAAKLRYVGRGTATVAAAALVMTSFGPTAFAAWDVSPQTIQGYADSGAELPRVYGTTVTAGGVGIADAELQDDGTIGIVDTGRGDVAGDQALPDHTGTGPSFTAAPGLNENPTAAETADENQGATLVSAGQQNQAIADVRITIPNRFKSGDIIDLRLMDRSATENTDGTSNSGPDTFLGFSADPTVSVSPAVNAGTVVDPDSDATQPANTETDPVNTWTSPGYAGTDTRNVAPGVAPKFTVQRSQTNGVQGSDNIRLRIDGNPSTGDPTAMWVVTLSDLKVDLGPQVSPGELRVVPFASSKFDNSDGYYATPWFMGNHKNQAVDYAGNIIDAGAREINTYTVPAYVAPVTVDATNLNIIADGNPQSIGTLSLAETKPYSLQTGTYKLYITGASIADTSALTAALTGGDTGESVSGVSTGSDAQGNFVQFTYTANGTDPKVPAKIDINGLMLSTSNPSAIRFRFAGGSLTNTWLAPAGYSQSVAGVGSSADFIVQPGAADPSLQWERATLGSTVTGPPSLSMTDPSTVTLSSPTVKLPAGTYTVAQGDTLTTFDINRVGGGLSLNEMVNAANTIDSDGANPDNATGSLAAALNGSTQTFGDLAAGTTFTVTSAGTIDTTTWTTPVVVAGLANLPAGTYTVTADAATGGFLIEGDQETPVEIGQAGAPTNVDNGQPITTSALNSAGIDTGLTFTFSNLIDGMEFEVARAETAVPAGANQKDILAPLDDLMRAGVAQATGSRIGGNNRYETAAKVAEQWAAGDKSLTHGKLKNVIIASGENFPDALSAAYLSQRMNAPILLTMRNRLPSDTVEALRDRQVEKVFVIGGEAAISPAVLDQITSLKSYYYDSGDDTVKEGAQNLQVQRLGGTTRYTTNQLVNMYAAAWGGSSTIGKTVYKYGEAGKNTAIFARGDNFPDALAAGVLTRGVSPTAHTAAQISAQALPLILTEPTSLATSAGEQIDRLDVEHALIIGSENAVSDGVKTSIEDKNVTTSRIGGADRYFTAAAVDEFAMRSSVPSTTNEYPGLGFLVAQTGLTAVDTDTTLTSHLATGLKFPDALTASPWIGRNRDALNLVWPNDLTDGTRDFLTKRAADVSNAVALGLGDAVSTKVLNDANKLASSK